MVYARRVRIGLVQRNFLVADFEGNVRKQLDGIADAARQGATLAVCSELGTCGYPPRDLLERPAFIDANLRALERIASEAEIPAIVGFVDRTDGNLYNAAAMVAGGSVRSVHRKALLPTYDVFDEWRYFAPTDEVTLAELDGVRIGISICEDIWNDADFWPRRRYRRDPIQEQVDAGAQLLVNISASPFAVSKRALRTEMLAAQARKHELPLIMVNQIGGNDDLIFEGASMAFDARGELSASAAELDEDVIVVDVDVAGGAVTGPKQATQSDASAALGALVLGTRDYVRKCGFSSALVGLSGGIDSALTAAVAARALGAQNVLGVSMPSQYSSDHSKSDAEALADALGITYRVVPIEQPFAAFERALAPAFEGYDEDVTEENIQARCRSVILMALSNKLGHMLLTTGNKSELAVGYCTLYGDMSGGLAVISDVPKTLVYELSREFNRQEGRAVIPESTLTKPPSAELRPGQLDQDSLPEYEVLDAILELYVEEHAARDEIVAAGFDATVVDEVLGLIRRSEYKRNQAAPGLKISAKAFGTGRRIPLAARVRD